MAVMISACVPGGPGGPSGPPVGEVPVPTVVGQLTGGTPDVPVNAIPPEIRERHGYTETEFAFEGTARSFAPVGTLGSDGMWSVQAAGSATYRTRLLVRAPADPAKFNGTVFVEWLNVSGGVDADPDFGFAHEALMRAGTAYVGVSVQAAGVVGGGFSIPIEGADIKPLVTFNPERYGELAHPGDDYSYDIFSQAAAAIRTPNGLAPLGGLQPEKLIAIGESQSAMRMVTYVNAIAPQAKIFDGYVIHSRGAAGAPLNGLGFDMPATATIRTDLAEPVMILQTEGDVFGQLNSLPARQPDTDKVVSWEIAGAAHADLSTIEYGMASAEVWSNGTANGVDFVEMCGRINDGPQGPVVRAAVSAMTEWVVNGTKPPAGDPLQLEADGATAARDQFGNALGGIRHPKLDVPIATHSGVTPDSSDFICALFGSTIPFDDELLAQLYPTHADYVEQVTAAADAAVTAGFLLPFDRDAAVEQAQQADVP